MIELLKEYENRRPEIIFEWKDQESEAEGWVVINSLREGAAGGETRMRPGLDNHEVTSLAKTMEIKFTVSGPPMGGAKPGINFDPSNERKEGVLRQWYKVAAPLLKSYYGTGGGLNINEVPDVIPIAEGYNVWLTEGALNGHYSHEKIEKINNISKLRQGISRVVQNEYFIPDVDQKFVIADLVTGYGISEAVRHYYDIFGGSIKEKNAIIQGGGNVASAAAFYLSAAGVRIVGIMDRDRGIVDKNGLDEKVIRQLFLSKKKNALNGVDLISNSEINEVMWDQQAEIFILAAAARLVTRDQIDRLVKSGLEVISCGANVPIADREVFYGPISEYADGKVSVIPDFIANCGMARVFACLMEHKSDISEEAIFSDVTATIKNALHRLHEANSKKTGLTSAAFSIALKQLV